MQVVADRALSRRRIDFAGRLSTPSGQIAKLYASLKPPEGYADHDAQFSP